MFPNLSIYYARCGAAGIFGGLILVGSPGMGMRWQGLFLILVGFLSLALWLRNPNPTAPDERTPKEPRPGPAFDIEDRDPSVETPTTSQLISEIRRNRSRQKRSRE